MKTALALLLALSVLTGGLLAGAASAVLEERDAVTIRAETLYGDPAAAEGIRVTAYTGDDQRHLFWRADLPADRPEEASITYAFSQLAKRDDYPSVSDTDLRINLPNVGMSSSSPLEEAELGPLAPLLEVARDAGADEDHPLTLRVGDYLDWLPLEVSVDWGGVRNYSDEYSPLTILFRDYFRIPVPENLTAEVSVETGGNGEIYGYNCYTSGYYGLECDLVEREDELLFAIAPSDDAVSLDVSQVPGGWGVYRLTGTSENDAALATVYSIPNGGIALRLLENADGSLLLFTVEGDMVVLTTLDGETFAPTQRMELFPWEDEYTWVSCFQLEGGKLALFSFAGPFLVLTPQGAGGWSVEFQGDASIQYDLNCGPQYDDSLNTTLLYDGERLVMTAPFNNNWFGTSFYLAVYRPDGLAYLGSYNTSQPPGSCRQLYSYRPSQELAWAETDS